MSAPKQEKQIFGMTLGAEPKQLAALGGLVVLLLIVWWVMRDPSDSAATSSASQTTRATATTKGSPEGESPVRTRGGQGVEAPGGPRRQGSRQALTAAVKEFKPSLKIDPDNPIDPAQTDPTIRFVALNKVQEVGMAGGGRSVFDFGAMTASGEELKPGAVNIKPVKVIPVYGPEKPPPLPPPPPTPPPPAIPLKFYGFVHTARGIDQRRAFFMENEDIYIASEGDLIKKRYKLVKIGINSAILEDTMVKNNRQTIKLTEEAKSN